MTSQVKKSAALKLIVLMRFLPAVILLGHDTFFQPSSDSQGSPSQVFLGSWNQQVVILCDAHNLSIWWTKWSFEGTQTIWCLLVSSAPEPMYIRDSDLHQIIIYILTSRKIWQSDVLVHHRQCSDPHHKDHAWFQYEYNFQTSSKENYVLTYFLLSLICLGYLFMTSIVKISVEALREM